MGMGDAAHRGGGAEPLSGGAAFCASISIRRAGSMGFLRLWEKDRGGEGRYPAGDADDRQGAPSGEGHARGGDFGGSFSISAGFFGRRSDASRS